MFFIQKPDNKQFIQKQSYHHPLECHEGHGWKWRVFWSNDVTGWD